MSLRRAILASIRSSVDLSRKVGQIVCCGGSALIRFPCSQVAMSPRVTRGQGQEELESSACRVAADDLSVWLINCSAAPALPACCVRKHIANT